jgi:hypothetical protein
MHKKNIQVILSVIVILLMSMGSKVHAAIRPLPVAEGSIEGRWDITIDENGKERPSWLEVIHSGSKWLIGYYVGIVGSARPISLINYKDGKMSFSIPPQWEDETANVSFEATFQGDSLKGTMIDAKGATYNWVGRRAPTLRRQTAPVWDKPITLFNGKNMDGWRAMGKNQWVVEGNVLKSPRSGANLVTDRKFNDFKLHIEFRCPKGSNSGVYLRGRYEVQIEDSKGKEPQRDLMGAVYGFLVPSEMAAKNAGEWQSYDITLIGRMVTIVANGKEIICNQAIPGITGGALDSREGEPGPLLIQGDHGPIEYRNIIVTPSK